MKIRMSFPVALLTGFVGSVVFLSVVLLVGSIAQSNSDPVPQYSDPRAETPPDATKENANTIASTKQEWTLEELSQIQSMYERQVTLREHLQTANEDQVNALLEESESMDQSFGSVLLKSELFGRLTVIDPNRSTIKALMYSWNIRSPYITAVFREWSSTDIDAAISHAETLSHFDQGVAVKAILRSASNLTDGQVEEIARNFDRESLATDLVQDRNVALSSHDPESAWYAILNDQRDDYDQFLALSRVAKVWIDQMGWGIVDRIEQSLIHFNTRKAVLADLARRLARSDPQTAFDYVQNWNDGPFNSSLKAVVNVWASREPSITMNAITTLDSGKLVKELQRSVISIWGRSDPRSLLEQTENLPSETREFGLERAITGLANEAPEEAAQLIDRLNDDGAKTRTQQTVVANLIEQDVSKALDWVLDGFEDSKKQRYLLSFVWPELVGKDLKFAMEIALQIPVEDESFDIGVEVDLIRNVAQKDIDQALSLLPQVRDGQTKVEAYGVVGVALASSGETDRAIELGLQLEESIQESYFTSLVSDWAYKDPLGLFASLENIPGENIKSTAAMRLQMANRFHKVFSNEQLDKLKEYQSAVDQKRLESFQR